MAVHIKHSRRRNRKLGAESLEARAMMASDVSHNFLFPQDVDDDGSLTPLDALVVINDLNRREDSSTSERKFHDVDDDSNVTPLDALIVINAINTQSAGTKAAHGQSSSFTSATSPVRVRVELETIASETELDIRVDQAPVSTAMDVRLNDIALGQLTTDSRGRGRLVLSQGDDNPKHLPLPPALTTLSPDMELVIGDIVKAKLSSITEVRDHSLPAAPGNSSATGSQELHLIAKFENSAGIRSAEFEQESEKGITKRSFKAEIEKAAPNTTFEVKIEDVVVGRIVTDNKGKGRLSIAPATFPVVGVGTKVSIGSISAVFQKGI